MFIPEVPQPLVLVNLIKLIITNGVYSCLFQKLHNPAKLNHLHWCWWSRNCPMEQPAPAPASPPPGTVSATRRTRLRSPGLTWPTSDAKYSLWFRLVCICIYIYIYLFIYIHVYMICVCECVSGIYVFENGGRICILWNVINYIKHWKRLSNMYLIVSIKFLKKIFSYEDGSRSSYVMEMYFNLMKQVIQ